MNLFIFFPSSASKCPEIAKKYMCASVHAQLLNYFKNCFYFFMIQNVYVHKFLRKHLGRCLIYGLRVKFTRPGSCEFDAKSNPNPNPNPCIASNRSEMTKNLHACLSLCSIRGYFQNCLVFLLKYIYEEASEYMCKVLGKYVDRFWYVLIYGIHVKLAWPRLKYG